MKDMLNAFSKQKRKAISICSGGMDSTSMGLAMLEEGYSVLFLHVDLEQKSKLGERLACKTIVKNLQSRSKPAFLMFINQSWLGRLGGSSLTDPSMEVPMGMESLELSAGAIGSLWTPARNVLLLACSSSVADRTGADVIVWGANQSEIGYKDNTAEFGERFASMLELGCLNVKPKVFAPLYESDKPHILEWGWKHGYKDIYRWSWSCDCEPFVLNPKPVSLSKISPESIQTLARDDLITCGKCGCTCNRRFAFLVAEKLWGIRDNQRYADEQYFYEYYLPDLVERCTEKMWMYRYLDIAREKLKEIR